MFLGNNAASINTTKARFLQKFCLGKTAFNGLDSRYGPELEPQL
jgi:hypothetical protein